MKPRRPKPASSPNKLIVNLAPPPTKDLPALRATVEHIAIATIRDRDSAYVFLREKLRPRIAALKQIFTKIKRPLNEARAALLDLEKSTLAPYIALDDRVEGAVLVFDSAERRRIAAEIEKRAKVPAARAQQDARDLLLAAKELVAEGDPDSMAAARDLREQATAVLRECPLATRTKPIEKGRTVLYHIEIVDFRALVEAALAGTATIAGPMSLELLEPERLAMMHPRLNQLARDHGSALDIPGVIVVPDESIR
jgi:hypothetical protein